MATVLIEYQGNVDGLEASLKEIEKANEQVSDSAKQSAKEVSDEYRKVAQASKAAFASQETKKALDEQNKSIASNVQSVNALARGLKVLFEEEKRLIASNKQNTEAFKRNQEEGKRVREEYDKLRLSQRLQAEETKKATEKTVTLRTSLKELKNELAILEEQGKRDSKQFQEIAIEAAKLETAISNTDKRIRTLSSATFVFDAAVDSVRALAGGFAVAQGAIGLFAEENEDLQRAIAKTNSALAILNGLNEVANFLTGQGAGKLGLQTVAQKAYALAVGTSTGAMKAFRLALAGTGVGLLVFALFELVSAFSDTTEATEDQTEANKKLQESYNDLEKSTKSASLRLKKAETDQLVLEGKLSEAVAERINLQIQANSEIQKINEDADKKAAERIKLFKEATFKDEKATLIAKRKTTEDLLTIEEERATLEKAIRLELSNEIKRLNQEQIKGAQDVRKAYETELLNVRQAVIQINNEIEQALLNENTTDQLRTFYRTRIQELETVFSREGELSQESFRASQDLIRLRAELEKQQARDTIANAEELAATINRIDAESIDKQRENRQAYFEAVAGEVLTYVNQVGNAFNQIADLQQELAERRITQIERISSVELAAIENSKSSEAQKQREREALELRTSRKIIEERRKIARLEKAQGIFSAVVSTAESILKTGAELGYPQAIPFQVIAGIIGAAQIAKISSEPLPSFGKGGWIEGEKHTRGGVNINAEGGEFITKASTATVHKKELEAMNTSRAAFLKVIEERYVRPRLMEYALNKNSTGMNVNVDARLNSASMENELRGLRKDTRNTNKAISKAFSQSYSSRYNWN